MAYIDKLLSKFNKAKQAINSIKGIQSKIQSINYTTALDELGEQAKKAEELLDARRTSLQESLGSQSIGQGYAAKAPKVRSADLMYPYHDELMNYIVFKSRPRRNRGSDKSPVHTERQAALYVPDAIISQANVTYQADGVNPIARALSEVFSADSFGAGMEAVNKGITKFAQQSLNALSGGFTNLKEGRAVNPMQEQMLNGIPFRSWDFTFDFWPKSAEEAEQVNKIIYFFRSSMLPDAYSEALSVDITPLDIIGGEDNKKAAAIKDLQKDVEVNPSYFNYPNIFDIYFAGPLGDKIDGFLPAVCTNAQVDYTGGQKFSTFADGQPVHIQLTLNFLEIKVMTLGNYETVRAGAERQDGDQVGDRTSILDNQSFDLTNAQTAQGRDGYTSTAGVRGSRERIPNPDDPDN